MHACMHTYVHTNNHIIGLIGYDAYYPLNSGDDDYIQNQWVITTNVKLTIQFCISLITLKGFSNWIACTNDLSLLLAMIGFT